MARHTSRSPQSQSPQSQSPQGSVWRAAQQFRSGMSQRTLHWLLRSGFVTGTQTPAQGFILPTVILMLLMMSLVVGVLIFRSFNRTAQVIGQKQQQVLYNAATPAIERGKSKIEYLFGAAGLPALPSDEALAETLALDTTYTLEDETRIDINGDGTLDNAWIYEVDGDGTTKTTVAYSLLTYANRVVTVGGVDTTISLDSPDATKANNLVVRNGPINLSGSLSKTGCENVTLSPLAGWQPVIGSQYRKAIQVHAVVVNPNTGVAATLEMQQDKVGNLGNKWGAWFRHDLTSNAANTFNWNGAMYTHGNFILNPYDTDATLRLFQISDSDSCVYDVNASEISMKGDGDGDSQSPDFQGQFVVGNLAENETTTAGKFRVHPYVASGGPTATQLGNNSDTPDLSRTNDSVKGAATGNAGNASRDTGVEPADIALDPVLVLTQDKNQYLDLGDISTDPDNVTAGLVFASGQTGPRVSPAAEWQQMTTGGTYQRISNASAERPYLDDLYRADNRWGPTASYNSDYVLGGSNVAGAAITGVDALTSNGPASLVGAEGDFGLDGYWERRARRIGVRVVVGERLELGNAAEFTGDGKTTRDGDGTPVSDPQIADDPLFPGNLGPLVSGSAGSTGDPADGTGMDEANANLTYNIGDNDKLDQRSHELRQWRSLRDNLAAVQAAAVYHYKADNGTDSLGQYPIACLAVTTHPGTQETEERSRQFLYNWIDTDADETKDAGERFLSTDFLTGQGTNGLEFTVPFTGAGSGAETAFQAEFDDSSSPLRIVLTNLAYFAGDWKSSTDNGAYPPVQDLSTVAAADKRMRPDPTMTMWGNFSNLRRIIESGTAYANLSTADQTTLHTATCTLGALAYNLNVEYNSYTSQVNELDDLFDDVGDFESLAAHFKQFIDGTGEGIGDKDDTLDGTCGSFSGENAEVNNMLNPGNTKCRSLKDWADANGYGTAYSSASDTKAFLNTTVPGTSDTYGGLFYNQFTLDDWRQVAANNPPNNDATEFNTLLDTFKQFSSTNIKITALLRDRMYGFRPGAFNILLGFVGSGPGAVWDSGWDPDTGNVLNPESDLTIKTNCDPGVLGPYTSANNAGTQGSEVAFALTLCQAFNTYPSDIVRYPSLYYLFPLAAHYHTGTIPSGVQTAIDTADAGIPEASQYYDADNNLATTGDKTPFNVYVDATSRGFNNTTAVLYRPVEDGLGACGAAACTPGTQDQVVDLKNENIQDFVTYLGVEPFTEVTPATTDENLTDAKLPITATTPTTTNPNAPLLFDTNKDGTTDASWYPAFLDTAFFDGRQQMLVRALSMDLDLMRRTNISNGNCTLAAPSSDSSDTNGNCWLPLPTIDASSDTATRTGAVIYAAREDAVREDAIARPAANTWANCATLAKITSTPTCRTNLFAGSAYGQDPPLNTTTGLSPKSVDFVPDPDRRPHGFRLRNGIDLRRISGGSTTFTNDNSRGLSFITPDSLYVQDHFNIHSSATPAAIGTVDATTGSGSTLVEEFTTKLTSTWSNFYERSGINANFAKAANDSWRVAELAADAVTVLSSNFCAGYIDRGIMNLPADCNNDGTIGSTEYHSFLAINKPSSDDTTATNRPSQITDDNRWWRENINGTASPTQFTTGGTAWPILISRNGFPVYNHDNATTLAQQQYGVRSPGVQQFAPFRDADLSNGIEENYNDAEQPRDSLNTAAETRVNAVVIAGINPGRQYQPDGALPIFLRTIENWDNQTLYFAGSLIQLNFSNAATGPQDQDAWEPKDTADKDYAVNGFYTPPTRAWGYDVALQYAAAGPVSERFRTASNVRSEFYRELAIDDPYITRLRCAIVPGATDVPATTTLENRVDPRVTTTECP